MTTPHELTQHIKAEALRLGFAVCGISKAAPLPPEEQKRYHEWLKEGMQGSMGYLKRNCDKREDPTLLMPECKSIISVALCYAQPAIDEQKLHISRYAQGEDYHTAVKNRLHLLLKSINTIAPVKGRPFCDTAPVMERFHAVNAGLGWIGRNHQLIIPQKGSYFFLGELFVDCELEYDTPFEKNHCGNCKRCIENCPTGALTERGFDARQCLSYLTIEHRGELPENIGKKMGNCFYGCDRCQTACPWNKSAEPTRIPEFLPRQELQKMNNKEWQELTKERYRELFDNSAVERAGYEQLMRNIEAIAPHR